MNEHADISVHRPFRAGFHDGLSRSRQRGRAGRPASARQSRLVLHLAQHHPAGRAGRTLHRARSDRLRSIRQARYPLPVLRPCPLSRRLDRRPRHQLGLSGGAGLGGRAGVSSGGAPARIWCAVLPLWSSSGRCRTGRISISLPRRAKLFRQFRTAGEGEAMILDGNAFIERVLPGSMLRKLERRRDGRLSGAVPDTARAVEPMLALARVTCRSRASRRMSIRRLNRAHAALSASTYPKLLFVAEPGALVSPAFGSDLAAALKQLRRHSSRSRRHYLQEDHAEAIGRSVAGWIAGSRPRPPARCGRPPELTRDAGDQNGRRIDHLLPALRL